VALVWRFLCTLGKSYVAFNMLFRDFKDMSIYIEAWSSLLVRQGVANESILALKISMSPLPV
jgi:hypothetical protein